MRLKVLLPTEVLIDEDVKKVVAEAANGSFGMLPHHIDFVAALSPGVLVYLNAERKECFLGTGEGILVKCGDEVMVSTRSAVMGDDLQTLKEVVEQRFATLDERERSARSALARLEVGVVRRFVELQERD